MYLTYIYILFINFSNLILYNSTIKDLNIDKRMEPLKQGFNSVLSSAETTFAKLVGK